jgi:hypothetical protein
MQLKKIRSIGILVLLILLFACAGSGSTPNLFNRQDIVVHQLIPVKTTSLPVNICALLLFTSICIFTGIIYMSAWSRKCSIPTGKVKNINCRRSTIGRIVYSSFYPYKRDANIDNWDRILITNRCLIELLKNADVDRNSTCVLILHNLYKVEEEIIWQVFPGMAKIKIWYEEIQIWIKNECMPYSVLVEMAGLFEEYGKLVNDSSVMPEDFLAA